MLEYAPDSVCIPNEPKTALQDGRKTALQVASSKVIDDNNRIACDLLAAENNASIIRMLSEATADLEAQPRAERVEEHKNGDRLLAQAGQNPAYTPEKISKLLEIQLRDHIIRDHINVELLDLANLAKAAISEQQLQNYVDSVIKGNKTLAIALHLHGEAWASLVIKHIDDNNLQLIYNDPASKALGEEPAARDLINSLAGLTGNGYIILRKIQQNSESDSGALVVNNLVGLAKATSLDQTYLQGLLSDASKINVLRAEHLSIIEATHDYNIEKFDKILQLSLRGEAVDIAPITFFDNKALLVATTIAKAQKVMVDGMPVVMPLSVPGKYWSGLVIKKHFDGSLQVIYTNSTGNNLMEEETGTLLMAAIRKVSPIMVHQVNMTGEQDKGNNNQSSGAFTVNNLVKLAVNDTSNLNTAQILEWIYTPLNIDELREQHTRLIDDFDRVIAPPEAAPPAPEASRVNEVFESKDDYPNENKNNNKEAPSHYVGTHMPPAAALDEPVNFPPAPAEPVNFLGGVGFPNEVT